MVEAVARLLMACLLRFLRQIPDVPLRQKTGPKLNRVSIMSMNKRLDKICMRIDVSAGSRIHIHTNTDIHTSTRKYIHTYIHTYLPTYLRACMRRTTPISPLHHLTGGQ